MDSVDIEFTDSYLSHATVVEHHPHHCKPEPLGTYTSTPQVTQVKKSCALKPPYASGQFSVGLVHGPAGFGLTLSRGQTAQAIPLSVCAPFLDVLLAFVCVLFICSSYSSTSLQTGDLVLHINEEPMEDFTHAQVVEHIRAGGPRLHLMFQRLHETHPGKFQGLGGP
ncbi:LOW QUALITY PROTEIN: PDZ domain-containing protein MAGIX [Ctenodactylus gundi]